MESAHQAQTEAADFHRHYPLPAKKDGKKKMRDGLDNIKNMLIFLKSIIRQ